MAYMDPMGMTVVYSPLDFGRSNATQVLMPWHMQQPSQPARGPLRGAKRWRCSGEDPGNWSILVGKCGEILGNYGK